MWPAGKGFKYWFGFTEPNSRLQRAEGWGPRLSFLAHSQCVLGPTIRPIGLNFAERDCIVGFCILRYRVTKLMAHQVITISGWKSRKLGSVPFYRCPGCGDCQDRPFWGPDGLVQCFRCHKKFPHGDFALVKKKRIIVDCAVCGREVPLIPCTCGALGYICSNCSNYVAIHYGRQAVQPGLVLDVDWNPTIWNRAEIIPAVGLSFVRCNTTKDYLVVQVLQAVAKKEDGRFLFVRSKEHWAGLLLDSSKRKYLGFVVWTEDKCAVLRQIFIVEDERRKGHAETLVKFWVERYADRLSEKFGIESPNEQAMKLHVKLGHVKVEGDSYVVVKSFLVFGL